MNFERMHSDEWIATEEEMLERAGYTHSASRCECCGHYAMVKVTEKPFRWESDLAVVTFEYSCPNCESEWELVTLQHSCPNCESEWKEVDSD